jgi:hypothetical protein
MRAILQRWALVATIASSSSLAWMVAGCEYNPNSSAVCSADSKEAVFARSLSQAQLETLRANSLALLAAADAPRHYENDDPTYPPIPTEFAYLQPWHISAFPSGSNSDVSILLKGCIDEFIILTVEKERIVLSYSTGSAVDKAEEVLWSERDHAKSTKQATPVLPNTSLERTRER